jgi:hypothetical protein
MRWCLGGLNRTALTLNGLLDLQGTDFEVVDCKVSEEKIKWRVRHREGIYECPRFHVKLNSCHAKRWITLKDTPLRMRQCIWQVERVQILCTCSNSLRVEYMPFRTRHHQINQIQVQQTGGSQYEGNGEPRPSLSFGLQFNEIDDRKSRSCLRDHVIQWFLESNGKVYLGNLYEM